MTAFPRCHSRPLLWFLTFCHDGCSLPFSSSWALLHPVPRPCTRLLGSLNLSLILAMASDPNLKSPTMGVGPEYRPDELKPTATVSTSISYENVHILPQTPQLIALLTCVPRPARQ